MLTKIKIDISTIYILSIGLFFVTISLYASVVYQQFSLANIGAIGICFILLFSFLVKVTSNIRYSFKLTFENVIISVLLATFLVINFFNEPDWLAYYYYTYPLIETDIGLFWHEDTAFHTSIIQSIIQNGFPSVAQHDIIPLFYHVLSHYIDALIILITGLEPYDSYGLLYFYKKWILIVSIVFFIFRLLYKQQVLIFIIVTLLFVPLFLFSWHSIGSHGLWFTTILFLFVFPNILETLQKTDILPSDYVFIFLMIAIISIGKISHGFFLGVFIGFFILVKDYKNLRVYIFGILLVLYFIIIYMLMNPISKDNIQNVHMLFTYNGVISFLQGQTAGFINTLLPIYILFFSSVIIYVLFRVREYKLYIFTTLLSMIALIIIIQIATFSTNNIFYFLYAIYTIALSAFIIIFSFSIEKLNWEKNKVPLYLTLAVTAVLLVNNILMKHNKYDYDKIVNNIDKAVFQKINIYKPQGTKISFSDVIKNDFIIDFPKHDNGLKDFRVELHSFMKEQSLNKKNTLLFVPKDVMKKELKQKEWAKGMLIYAVLGVPLLYGLGDLRPEYGYSSYDKQALRKNIDEIDLGKVCENEKTIIYIESFKKKIFKKLCE